MNLIGRRQVPGSISHTADIADALVDVVKKMLLEPVERIYHLDRISNTPGQSVDPKGMHRTSKVKALLPLNLQ